MLGKKAAALIVVLLGAAVLLTGEARARLDRLTESFRNSFREMLYLPRGDHLKIMACGFDAPLADALYIRGLVFYSQAMLEIPDAERDAARSYNYALFDVITDLSPRFLNAYRTGGTLFASANSLKTNLDSIRLLDKGVAYWTKLEERGTPAATDPRWLFHLMNGVTYNINVQNRLAGRGDMEEAAEARRQAMEEFRLAALSPQAPDFVMEAGAGFQRARSGRGDVEADAVTVQNVWTELRDRALAKGEEEVAKDLLQRMETNGEYIRNIRETRGAEASFSRGGKAFMAARGRAPRSLEELVEARILRSIPQTLPLDSESAPDVLLSMPDGSFKSRRLADLETERQLRALTDSIAFYRRANQEYPPDLPILVATKFLDILPEPPLAALGQRFEYNPQTGRVDAVMPLGPGF